MREPNLQRLADFSTSIDEPYFLTLSALNAELLRIAPLASGRLLDIGCGNKPYLGMLQCVDAYIGCDIVQSSNNKVDVMSSAMSLPFSANSFDTVFSTQVIEHVEDHQCLCNEAYRVLKTGGYFLLAGPMYWHLHEEPYDFFRFTKHGFRLILEKAGFEVVEIKSNGGKWAVLGQVLIHTVAGENFRRRRFIRIVNRVFSWLDQRHYDDFNTLNYVAVARRSA
jgi:SAM-dependent methyltransferase